MCADEDFRVIALGLPVPRYIGNLLGPPLRSRFQARDVSHLSYQLDVNFGCRTWFCLYRLQ
ncbi:von Willebrand factor A domain-containing protein 8 [Chrysoperla carnea]|uniref:von Willebrand factor A domain-containing protein 8 n=1 Tax=Chrysoperla carnea TaxID=189513 RepID=UPI001D079A17|nr:von Willebrand factor A domain-containing protein 8 [Chrysoperla carnea]XP_044730563.1 von Willebrand factor A domain-containing protein 8 [Chrysoperla carnea]XP_044730564.1 von Willebrand factor A domain-containing protein 8 [Chrysoperla carnea]XP_044730565.1 von Willebrand factor A domain-containing protein 8 [Chrysoperla carnea]XP_044730566.1 von Willebrand factor A domain-containing protein 8 [Chrysoperla carnea]